MVEHRIRIADRAVRNRHGPLMGGKKVECQQCGIHATVVASDLAEQIRSIHIAIHKDHVVQIGQTSLDVGTDLGALETASFMRLTNLLSQLEE